jgi:3-deoxy-D-manno-octulosonic-acid transferase
VQFSTCIPLIFALSMLSRFLYIIFVYTYKILLFILSPFIPKAKLWLKGRNKASYQKLFNTVQGKNTIWMHAASLGEYEQGRPVLDALHKKHPDYTFVVSFFSPSGYEHVSKSDNYFLCTYLPLDTPGNAKKFIRNINPQLVLWIKYDYWYYTLRELYRQQVPVYLVSAIFLPTQPFFKWYGMLHREMLGFFTKIFVQHNESKTALLTYAPSSTNMSERIVVTGDTRYARAIEIANTPWQDNFIDAFCTDSIIIVAGSTWPSDNAIIEGLLTLENIKCIIAPHNIGAKDMDALKRNFPNHITYTALAAGTPVPDNSKLLMVDTMGMLSKLYRKATVAYVGGGFTKDGIHNVLEPAAYNIPVIFGSNYHKYYEAFVLLQANAAISIQHKEEAIKEIKTLLYNKNLYQRICNNVEQVIISNSYAVPTIISNL